MKSPTRMMIVPKSNSFLRPIPVIYCQLDIRSTKQVATAVERTLANPIDPISQLAVLLFVLFLLLFGEWLLLDSSITILIPVNCCSRMMAGR